MKVCTQCKKNKNTSEFTKNRTSKDGLRSNCKMCSATAKGEWYLRNKGTTNERAKIRKRERILLVAQLKDNPCMDCGQRFHYTAMDFDHVRDFKKFSISAGAHTAMPELLAEIAKCDLVCSNCHRFRTWSRWRLEGKQAQFKSETNHVAGASPDCTIDTTSE